MINCPKGQLNPVMFGVVIALASILVVTVVSQPALAFIKENSAGEFADIDITEAAEAGNATTMAGATNQTITNGNTTEFLSIQSTQPR
jgi:membrane-associated protease RseP (regulator of RpoE activity)